MPGPRDYSRGTRAALAMLSKGSCYYPGCGEPTIVFIEGEPIINYHIAHIRDANPGNRYVAGMTDDERRSFANLVLLCKPHHDWVDKVHPDRFTIEDLDSWKEEREQTGIDQLRGVDGLTENRLRELIREVMSAGSEHAPLDWRLDSEAFDDAAANSFSADDDIGLHRFLEKTSSEWLGLIAEGAEEWQTAYVALDRLACLAANAIRWGRPEWAPLVCDTLEEMFSSVLTDHGSVRTGLIEPGHRYLMAITNRVLGIGAVARSAGQWGLIVDLAIRRPTNLHPIYSNWTRNTTTEAARAGALQWTTETQDVVKGSYIEVALMDVGDLGCLNRNAPDVDAFRTDLACVDALFAIAVAFHAPGDHDSPYYPWHRAYEPDRYEPALVELLTIDELRAEIFPGSDAHLAQTLLQLQTFSKREFTGFGGGWPYVASEIRRFLDSSHHE